MNHHLFLAARGETSTIKAWNLRPSLIWKDGEWFELSSSYVNDYSHEVLTILLFVLTLILNFPICSNAESQLHSDCCASGKAHEVGQSSCRG